MYFWIRESWKLDDTIIGTPDIGDDEIDFTSGRIINEIIPLPIRFETTYEPKSNPHHYYDYGTCIPVISKFLLNILEKSFVDNFQVFPAMLYNPKMKAEWHDFYAFNVIGMVNATDLDASRYGEIMPGNDEGVPSLGSFTVLALKEEKIHGFDMFREPVGNNLIFSERLLDFVFDFDPPNGGKFGILAHEVILT